MWSPLAKRFAYSQNQGMSTQTQGVGVPVDTFELRLAITRAFAGGISAREAGLRVGVSGQTWRNWEAGNPGGAMRPAMLSYIARQLGVDETWLRDGGPLRASDGGPSGPGGQSEAAVTSQYVGGGLRLIDQMLDESQPRQMAAAA